MKPQDKILTYEQAKELRWFSNNCTGLRTEYYTIVGVVEEFKGRLERLEKTCQLIETFFEKNITEDPVYRSSVEESEVTS